MNEQDIVLLLTNLEIYSWILNNRICFGNVLVPGEKTNHLINDIRYFQCEIVNNYIDQYQLKKYQGNIKFELNTDRSIRLNYKNIIMSESFYFYPNLNKTLGIKKFFQNMLMSFLEGDIVVFCFENKFKVNDVQNEIFDLMRYMHTKSDLNGQDDQSKEYFYEKFKDIVFE